MAYKLAVLILILVSLLVLQSKSLVYFVHPNSCSFNNVCLTLSDIVNDKNLFTSNTKIVLLEGRHFLNTTLASSSLHNIEFCGTEASEIVLTAGSSISWTNSSKISFKSLKIFHSGQDKSPNISALLFNNSKSITLKNISFSKIIHKRNSGFRAVGINESIVQLENCTFSNGYSDYGGAVGMSGSRVTFSGYNVFNDNVAEVCGGAVYGRYSEIFFGGNNIYKRNEVVYATGSAIYAYRTNITFNGFNTFLNNKFNLTAYLSSVMNTQRGSAISASYSSIIIRGVAHFIKNSGTAGGAIYLLSSFCHILGYINFISNSAYIKGGAINAYDSHLFVQNEKASDKSEEELYESSTSFKVQHTTVRFYNNSAGIFGGGIHLNNSTMTCSGSVNFIKNQASKGGGISYLTQFETSTSTGIELQEPLN